MELAKEKRAYFVPLILSKAIFFNICVLSQCIVYWRHFQNKHTFTYQKALLHTRFCLFLKSSKVFSVSLKHRVSLWLYLIQYLLKSKNLGHSSISSVCIERNVFSAWVSMKIYFRGKVKVNWFTYSFLVLFTLVFGFQKDTAALHYHGSDS